MFANDTKIYSVIKGLNDSLKLLRDIDYLMQSYSSWLLRFNDAKVMRINNSNLHPVAIIHYGRYHYQFASRT